MIRNSVGAAVVIAGLLFFTSMGSFVLRQLQQTNSSCSNTLSFAGAAVVSPVCNALNHGVRGLNNSVVALNVRVERLKDEFRTVSAVDKLNGLVSEVRAKYARFASSSKRINQAMAEGPDAFAQTLVNPLQKAIDYFSIGQRYLDSELPGPALSWLKQGASLPDGYGVLSQLALGNLYASGQHGIQRNPKSAQKYLEQARDSLSTLMANNTVDSMRLLQALPIPPLPMQVQLELAIRQLKAQQGTLKQS